MINGLGFLGLGRSINLAGNRLALNDLRRAWLIIGGYLSSYCYILCILRVVSRLRRRHVLRRDYILLRRISRRSLELGFGRRRISGSVVDINMLLRRAMQ